LLLEIQRREALLARIRTLLPASVAGHCTQAAIEEGLLTLICDSPAWVDRLRFLSPQLMSALVAAGDRVRDCRVRARPAAAGPYRPAARRAPAAPGGGAVQAVEQSAAALGDTPLANSLRRLAATLRGAD
jgi:hypothetical protein